MIAPRTRWHRLKANYSTGDQTDESWTWGRWLSICPKRMSAHLYACVRGRQRLNAILTSVKVCCVFVCVHACLWACTKQAQQLSESPCSYATWIHSKKCHPHSNYNTSMASCPTVMRGERVWMCACVCVCPASSVSIIFRIQSLFAWVYRMPKQQVHRDANHSWLHDCVFLQHSVTKTT